MDFDGFVEVLKKNGYSAREAVLAAMDHQLALKKAESSSKEQLDALQKSLNSLTLKQSSSRVAGTVTAAQLYTSLKEEGRLKQDGNIDAIFNFESEACWVEAVENPVTLFPALASGEKAKVQPFFTEVLNKFNTAVQNKKMFTLLKKDGTFTKAVSIKDAVVCRPTGELCDTPTIGTRKPDIVVHHRDGAGIWNIMLACELKSRDSDEGDFASAEVGHLIDTNFELLRQQPLRRFTYSFISDGFRFQFFKVSRDRRDADAGDAFNVQSSRIFSGLVGWKCMFQLFMSKAKDLGFEYYSIQGYNIERVIGRGAQSVVFEVSKEGSTEPYVLKMFFDDNAYSSELSVLQALSRVTFPSGCALVPHDVKAVVVTEIIAHEDYSGILTLPLCKVIRPTRDGDTLSRANRTQLLNTLKFVHSTTEYVNADIKPGNILVDSQGTAVICDWGAAVKVKSRIRVGTVGFCDFTLKGLAPALFAHDLKALVRTIYCNYTDHNAIKATATSLDTDEFWATQFANGSIWSEMMEAADRTDYDGLQALFDKL